MASLDRAEGFNVDFDMQHRWYLEHAGESIAERFVETVLATLRSLAAQPDLGIQRKFRHPALRGLRSMQLKQPFQKILLFYRSEGDTVQAWRLMHGARDLPRRLAEPPGSTG